MAIASSAGAEVQRPLATVVIFGIVLGTLVTMAVLPGILLVVLRGYRPAPRHEEDDESAPAAAHPHQPSPAQ
jgi:cobalt-zinc-cadmium resistance protein CzcA